MYILVDHLVDLSLTGGVLQSPENSLATALLYVGQYNTQCALVQYSIDSYNMGVGIRTAYNMLIKKVCMDLCWRIKYSMYLYKQENLEDC